MCRTHDLSKLKSISIWGGRCDANTVRWLHNNIPDAIINEIKIGGETVIPYLCNPLNVERYDAIYPTYCGSATKPTPGYDIKVYGIDSNDLAEVDELGNLMVKMPLPPGFMYNLHGEPNEEFIAKHF